jgi:hypothetical protein
MPAEMDASTTLRRGKRTVEDREIFVLYPRRSLDRIVRVDVVQNPPDFRLVVSVLAEGHRHSSVDDLQHASTSELLVFDKRNIWLDTGCIAIHHESDRPSWSQHRHLAVTVAVLAAHFEALGPNSSRFRQQLCRRRPVDCVGRVAMHLHNPQHRLAINREAIKCSHVCCMVGAGQIRLPVHDRGDRRRKRSASL